MGGEHHVFAFEPRITPFEQSSDVHRTEIASFDGGPGPDGGLQQELRQRLVIVGELEEFGN